MDEAAGRVQCGGMVRTLMMPGVLLKSDTPLGGEGLSLTPASALCAPEVIPTVLASDNHPVFPAAEDPL